MLTLFLPYAVFATLRDILLCKISFRHADTRRRVSIFAVVTLIALARRPLRRYAAARVYEDEW